MPTAKHQPATNRHDLPRYIPEDVAREVRKRCGFGCVVCGFGLYEYEHFNPVFAEAKEHNPNGITLLCPNHHGKKTRGGLSIERVRRANAKPKALQQGFASEKFDILTDNPVIIIGTAKPTKTPVLLQIENEPILTIAPGEDEDEPFLITATLRDSNGRVILEIDKNEWKTPSDTWDCRTVGQRIEIRSKRGSIELILRQEPPHTIVIERLVMMHRGCKIEAYEGKNITFTTEGGARLQAESCVIDGCRAGIMLTHNSISLGLGGGSVSLTGHSGLARN